MAKTSRQHKEVQVGKEYTDRCKRSDRFYTGRILLASGRPIFYFSEIGDYLKGVLDGASHQDFLHYSNKTYLIKVFEGRQGGKVLDVGKDHVEEIVAYKDLRRIIEQNKLMHSIVRIIVAGKLRTIGGNFRYVWEVWKGTGTFYENEEQKTAKPPRKRRKKGVKNGKGKNGNQVP